MKNAFTSEEAVAILKYVAAHSPEEFADKIRERNTEALNIIEEFEDGGNVDDMSGIVQIGCPHCTFVDNKFICVGCVWVKAIKKIAPDFNIFNRCPCSCVPFNGVCLEDQNVVGYGCHNVTIEVYDVIGNELIDDAKAFLKGHISWANWENIWGTEC